MLETPLRFPGRSSPHPTFAARGDSLTRHVANVSWRWGWFPSRLRGWNFRLGFLRGVQFPFLSTTRHRCGAPRTREGGPGVEILGRDDSATRGAL